MLDGALRDPREDQAEGLRRMFARRGRHVLGIAGDGATAVTVSLAGTLARQGQRVLVLDRARGEAAAALGLRARFDLAQALDGDVGLTDALVHSVDGITLLPAARGLDRLAAEGGDWSDRLESLLAPVELPCRAWLVNGVLPAASWGELLMVVPPTPSGVTVTYAQIKALHRDYGFGEFRVVVDRAQSERTALRTFRSVAETARRFLGARLEYLGYLPRERAAGGGISAEDHSARATALLRLAESVVPTVRCSLVG